MRDINISEEWKRSKPDIKVFIPQKNEYEGDNEHLLVFESPKGDLLALWTQSSVEGHGDNHLVITRSKNQKEWSKPLYIAGVKKDGSGKQASWGVPIVTNNNRIYIIYNKDIGIYDLDAATSGLMGCVCSDDDGYTWNDLGDIEMPRVKYDNPDSYKPKNWIAWQKPIKDSKNRWLLGYTLWSSPEVKGKKEKWFERDSRCYFMRFENIDSNPKAEEMDITFLPFKEDGLEVPLPNDKDISVAQEPSIVLLPDDRIFCTMRTYTGYIWYSISDDDAETFVEPKILRYNDTGEYIKQPIAPCAVYSLDEKDFMLLFHNNSGYIDRYGPEDVLHNRRPAFVSFGKHMGNAKQPIWFDKPQKFLDTDDITVGPKGTSEIGTYTSMTEYNGKKVLWYPDRKYFLLGKYIR